MDQHPFFTGSNIRLRAMEPEDIDVLYEWENDPSIWPVSNTLTPFSKLQIREFVIHSAHDIFTDRQLRLMVELTGERQTAIPIGTVDFFEFDPFHLRAGMGILIREPYQNQGHAIEAVSLVIRFAFEILGMHQLFCNISPENKASLRLFTKMGFVQCGIKKEWNKHGKTWKDEWMFQLINDKG